ncbi:NgoPII family restriction endonuclease [Francisella tularensis subsp. holarctica]|nr:NgoPII family restriction endonuclease [Francisella tularensis subsp. holarctica]
MIYCVCHTDYSELKYLWMVYGSIYAAKQETY